MMNQTPPATPKPAEPTPEPPKVEKKQELVKQVSVVMDVMSLCIYVR